MILHTWDTCKGKMPPTIDVDGIRDRTRPNRIGFIGQAVRTPEGMYRCLANVEGSLCYVEVSIEILTS